MGICGGEPPGVSSTGGAKAGSPRQAPNWAMPLAVMFSAFALDQTTKWLVLEVVMRPPRSVPVTPFLNLTLGFNPGVSFGLFREALDDHPRILAAAMITVAAGLLAWSLRAERRIEAVGFALLAGGALGNALDRWRQGAVTDFVDLHAGGLHWPAFNLADVTIVGGAALVVLAGVRPRPVSATPPD